MKKKHIHDLILIGICLLIAGSVWLILTLTKEPGATAVVQLNGEIYGTYPLSEDIEVRIETPSGGYNILTIADGKASVTEASCPDKLCVHQHEIDAAGETIVCLPNKVVVLIESEKEPEVDLLP